MSRIKQMVRRTAKKIVKDEQLRAGLKMIVSGLALLVLKRRP
jgi:hypothetical protein